MSLLLGAIGAAQGLLNFLLSNQQKVFRWFGKQFDIAWNIVWNISQKLYNAFNQAKAFVLTQINWVRTEGFNFAVGLFNNVINQVFSVVRSVVASLSGLINSAVEGLKGLVTSFYNRSIGFAREVFNIIKAELSKWITFLRGQLGFLTAVFEDISGRFNSVWAWVKKAASQLDSLDFGRLKFIADEAFDILKVMISNPMFWWSKWAVNGLMDLLVDQLATEISPGDSRVDRPIIQDFEDIR